MFSRSEPGPEITPLRPRLLLPETTRAPVPVFSAMALARVGAAAVAQGNVVAADQDGGHLLAARQRVVRRQFDDVIRGGRAADVGAHIAGERYDVVARDRGEIEGARGAAHRGERQNVAVRDRRRS